MIELVNSSFSAPLCTHSYLMVRDFTYEEEEEMCVCVMGYFIQ